MGLGASLLHSSRKQQRASGASREPGLRYRQPADDPYEAALYKALEKMWLDQAVEVSSEEALAAQRVATPAASAVTTPGADGGRPVTPPKRVSPIGVRLRPSRRMLSGCRLPQKVPQK